VGGNRIDYPWNKSTPTADLTTAKLLFNSTISTPGASFYGINLANFCLNTPMERYEYMRLWLDILPQEIIDKYNPTKIVDTTGWVYVRICKGMYRLPQTGILANKPLKHALPSEAIINVSTHLAFGITCGMTSPFALSPTTLASRRPAWPI
jgi:hypothetical protein